MAEIYLDHNATAPPLPEAIEAMQPHLREAFGNASSVHARGEAAKTALESARESVAVALGVRSPREVLFTSGGTESDHLALRGVLRAKPSQRHLVVTAIEHEAVLNLAHALEREGHAVTIVAPDERGTVAPERILQALRPDTALVSVMHANNETGVLQPIEAIGARLRERGIAFHVDAVQTFGKHPFAIDELPVDLVSVSGHKMGAPQGVGALWIRQGLPFDSPQAGGAQERGRRPGTHNLPAIVAFGVAAHHVRERVADHVERIAGLRDRLEAGLIGAGIDAIVHGFGAPRVANTSFVSFPGIDGEAALQLLDQMGIAVSSGSACTAGNDEPSHVLLAMGVTAPVAKASVRFSLGPATTASMIDEVLERTLEVVTHLRAIAPRALDSLYPT